MQFDWNTFLFQIQEKMSLAEKKITFLEDELNAVKIKLKKRHRKVEL